MPPNPDRPLATPEQRHGRRRMLRACAAALLPAVVPALHPAARAARPDPITLAGWSKPITEITNMLAEPDKGFFRDQGIALTYLPGAGGGDAVRHLLAGQADVAFTDPGSFFAALDRGERLRAIYDVYPQNVFNVVSRTDRGIRTPADLRGRKVGVYSLSSGTRQNLQILLHTVGLKERDVTVVPVGLLNFAPLMQGQVDATAATDTGLAIGRRRGLADVHVMEVREHLNVSSDLLVVREATWREQAPLLRRLLAAVRASVAWMIAQPDEAARLAVRHAIDGRDEAINREIIQLRNASSVSALTRREGLGTLDLPMLRRAAEAYRAIGVLNRDIDIDDIVATDLLAKVG